MDCSVEMNAMLAYFILKTLYLVITVQQIVLIALEVTTVSNAE